MNVPDRTRFSIPRERLRMTVPRRRRVSLLMAAVMPFAAVVTVGAGQANAQATAASTTTTVPATTTELAGGGSTSTYALPDGQVMVVNTPPAGFDPATASNAALHEYGFPSAPSSGSAHGWQHTERCLHSRPNRLKRAN